MRSRKTLFAVHGAVATLGAVLAWASTSAQPAATVAGGAPSQAVVEQRLEEVQADTALDEAAKNQLLELYRRTLGHLEVAKANAASADAFARARETAPAETSRIRADLERRKTEPAEAELDLPDQPTAQEIDQRLQQEKANQAAVAAKVAEYERQLAAENARPGVVRQQIVAARQQSDALADQQKLPPPPDESAAVTEARGWIREAHAAAVRQQIRMLDQELLSQPARIELLQAELDKSALSLRRIQQRVKILEERLVTQRRVETEQVIAEIDLESLGEAGRHPVVQELVERNRKLAEQLTVLRQQLEAATEQERQAGAQLKEIQQNYQSARQKLEIAGLSQAIGRVLHEQRRELPDVDLSRRESRQREQAIAEAGLRSLGLEEEWRSLRDTETYVDALLTDVPQYESERIRAALTQLAEARRPLLEKTIDINNELLRQLAELEFRQTRLSALVSEYDDFLTERLLWVRSENSLGWVSLKDVPREIGAVLSPGNWLEAIEILLHEFTRSPLLGISVLVVLLLLWKSARIAEAVRATSRNVGKPSVDTFTSTLRAVGLSALLTITWPLLSGMAGWHLIHSVETTAAAKAIGEGLLRITIGLFFLRSFRVLCMKDGVAGAHFRWSDESLSALRRQLDQLLLTFILPGFVAIVAFGLETGEQTGSLGQIAFILMLFGLSRFLVHLLGPRRGIVNYLRRVSHEGPAIPLPWLWITLAIALPAILAVMALAGYMTSAGTLMRKLMQTMWLAFLILLVRELVVRWLLILRRRLLLQEALRRREAARAARAQEAEAESGGEEAGEALEEPQLDIATLGADTSKLVNVALVVTAAIGVGGIWSSVLPALGVLEQVTFWSRTQIIEGESQLVPVTLADLGLGLLIGFVTYVAARNIPSVLEIILRQRPGVTAGSRLAFATLARYTIALVGGIIALGSIGADWSKLQWLVAALGVGIGFGLQEIVANFISGLIILLERPVRVGDVVTVGDTSGTVTRVQIRATTIRNWDRQELLVPNKEFITGRVLNWSLSDEVIRIHFMVGIAYGSDVGMALALIEEAARENETVLKDPAPFVTFEGFGDNSLNLGLRCFVPSLNRRLETVTALHRAINDKFNAAGIVIAFPQRDVHLDTSSPLDIRLSRAPRMPEPGGA